MNRDLERINIDGLSEQDLIDLNRRVVERLRLIRQVRTHVAMLEFRIGESVSFAPEGRGVLIGTITRYNRKSVTVVTSNGESWRVAPSLLSRVTSEVLVNEDAGNLVPLKKR